MELSQIVNTLRTILSEEQSKREDCSMQVADPCNSTIYVPQWVLLEREVMLEAVNRMRHNRGRPRITIKDVALVGQTNSGHVDYTKKFVLYCAELVLKE